VLSLFIRGEVFFAAFASFAVKSKKKGRMRGAAPIVEELRRMYWKNQKKRFLFP